MSVPILLIDGAMPDEASLARALALLRLGHLLVYPTDTLYALGGRALDPAVARRVRKAKGRSETKPLPLVAADREQAASLCGTWPAAAEMLAARFWPGPLTLVLPAHASLPSEVTAGSRSVAVRVPALRLTRELCSGAGPLVSTSANKAGERPPTTCAEAALAVGDAAALALDAGRLGDVPSTVVDLTEEPRLVRGGAVPWDDVRAALATRSAAGHN